MTTIPPYSISKRRKKPTEKARQFLSGKLQNLESIVDTRTYHLLLGSVTSRSLANVGRRTPAFSIGLAAKGYWKNFRDGNLPRMSIPPVSSSCPTLVLMISQEAPHNGCGVHHKILQKAFNAHAIRSSIQALQKRATALSKNTPSIPVANHQKESLRMQRVCLGFSSTL